MKLLMIIFFFSIGLIAKAQTPSDSIFIHKSFFGYKFYQTDARLNFNQLPYIMEADQEAFEMIKKASSKNTIAAIISGTGGLLLGWQLVTAAIGGDPDWTMAGVGAGLIVISIPISIKSNKQSVQAVELYNGRLAARRNKQKLILATTNFGVGVKLPF